MGRERGNRLRTGTSIGRLLRHACTDRKGWSVILVVTLLTSVFGLLRPWPIKILVDHVLGDAPMPLLLSVLAGMLPGADTPPGMLVWVVLSGLVIFAVSSLLEVLLTRAWIRVGQRMVYDLAAELFTRIQRRSLLFHSRHPVGDLLNRITGDCWCVYKVVDTYLFMPLFALMMIVAMVAVMLRTDVTLTLLAVVAAPFMIGTSILLGRPMRLIARARREIDSAIKSHVQQTLLGIPVVQAFAQEEREQERFQYFARESLRAQRRGALLGSFAGLATGLAGTLGTGAVLWLGAHHVLEGRLSLGDLLVFIAYLAALQTQLKALMGLYGSFQEQSASADRVVELLDSEPEVRDRPDAVALASVEGLVCFENVSFGYDPGRPVLRDITLTVKPGQTVALVGATGAGKTTLASLIPRFFDPWHGRVTIDGMDLRNVRLADLRTQVGLVLQEPFLFSMTIAENIAFANSHASRDEIEVAARAASLHDFIQALPAGYDTPIGPRGLTLSGGERQRVAIARALLKNAPILILDEPTSALDAETERLFLQALTRLMRGRTTIILAHRLSTIRQADQIFVLEEGRLAEAGTHRQLLEQDGVYARLYGTPLGVPEPQAQLQGQL